MPYTPNFQYPDRHDISSVFQSFYSWFYLRLEFTVIRTELDETCFFKKESGRLSAKKDTHGGEEKPLEKERPGYKSSVQFSCSVVSNCDPMNCSMSGLPVHHQLPEFTQTTSIESVMPSSHLIFCHPLLFLPLITPSISLSQWANSLHEVAKVLEFQLYHQSL